MIFKEPVFCRRPVYRVKAGLEKEVRVALAGDWHVSRIVSGKQRRMLEQKLVKIRPDVIILQGDLLDTPKAFLDSKLVAELKKSMRLCAKIAPTVMVLGNHDQVEPVSTPPKSKAEYYARVFPGAVNEWRKACRETGVKLLLDSWFEVKGLRIFGFLQGPEAYYRKPGEKGENYAAMKRKIKELSEEGVLQPKEGKVDWFAAHAPIEELYKLAELRGFKVLSFGHTHGGCLPIGVGWLADKLGWHGGIVAPFLRWWPMRFMRGRETLKGDRSFIVNTGMVMTQESAPKLLQYCNFLKSAEVTEVIVK